MSPSHSLICQTQLHKVRRDHIAQSRVLILSGFLLPSGHLHSPKPWQQIIQGLISNSAPPWSSSLGLPCGLGLVFTIPSLWLWIVVSWCCGSHETTKLSLDLLSRDTWWLSQNTWRMHDPRATTICALRVLHPAALSIFLRVIVKVPIGPWPLKMSTGQESFLCSFFPLRIL